LLVKNGLSEIRLSGMSADDFPPIPDEFEPYARIEATELQAAIEATAYCAAKDDTRPVLQCVEFRVKEDVLTMAAMDGFRLAVYKVDCEGSNNETPVLISGKSLIMIGGLLKGVKEQVDVLYHEYRGKDGYIQNAQVAFVIGHTTIVCQCDKGTFPNYSVLIPTSYLTHVEVSKDALAAAVACLKPIAAAGSDIVRIELIPGDVGRLMLIAESKDTGESRQEMPCQYIEVPAPKPAPESLVGTGRRIAFNCKYLEAMLSSIATSLVGLEITTPSSPGVFRPVGGQENYLQIIMPVFVQW